MKPFFDMSLLIAFGFLSLLLLLGVLLRAKIKFLQNFMVPACLTGGVIGFFILNTTGFPQVQPELYPALAYHFFTISFVCIGLRGMSKVDQSKGSATKEMVRGSIWQAQMFHMGLCSQLILATGIVYLLNALTGQEVSLVSEGAGTTTSRRRGSRRGRGRPFPPDWSGKSSDIPAWGSSG